MGIANPGYKGKWKPAMIPNPDYYFDNLLITDDLSLADGDARETFDLKQQVLDAAGGNIFQRILSYSNKNPWLYAVYVVLVGLPTVLIITFCCSGGGDKSEDSKSSLNDPKKTDDVQEDDEVVEEVAAAEVGEEEPEVEEEGEGEEEEEGGDEPPTTRSQTRKRRPRKD